MLAALETFTRAELFATGYSRRGQAAALQRGEIVRARRDRYLSSLAAPTDPCRRTHGGRLTCLSLLQLLGVFVFKNTQLHVHVCATPVDFGPDATQGSRLPPLRVRRFRVHWMPLVRPDDGTSALRRCRRCQLIHAVLRQSARHAVATLDSALNWRIDRRIRARRDLPSRLRIEFGVLLPLFDARAESGAESLMRLSPAAWAARWTPQVEFAGIGRVDLLSTAGWSSSATAENSTAAGSSKRDRRTRSRR